MNQVVMTMNMLPVLPVLLCKHPAREVNMQFNYHDFNARLKNHGTWLS